MYRDLGFLRVWGGQAGGPEEGWDLGGAPYAYLVYPHKPIVAYLPQTGQLLNEYCVEFPDETKPVRLAAPARLRRRAGQVDGLKGDEQRLIGSANLHLPGRQIDPRKVARDLWRLRQWERERSPALERRPPRVRPSRRRLTAFRPSWTATASISSTGPVSSPRARTAPPRAPTCTASASTPRR